MEEKKERDVKIEFLSEHLGHLAGSKKIIGGDVANELISLGVAKEIPMPVKKTFDGPPVDKMVKEPPKKKSFSRNST